MIINDGYILRKIEDCYFFVPVKRTAKLFEIIYVNEIGANIYSNIVDGISKENLIERMIIQHNKINNVEDTIKWIGDFIDNMLNASIVLEEK
jgi:hypothetical protein